MIQRVRVLDAEGTEIQNVMGDVTPEQIATMQAKGYQVAGLSIRQITFQFQPQHGPKCNDGVPIQPEGTYSCPGCA